jgi:riboflavin kinase/FMN adenylyltransferase
VVTGEDFTFGKARGGNVALLRDVGAGCGIATRQIGPVEEDGQVISSSRIRDALKAGECETAARLLTRPFTVRGPVIHGDKRGRDLGYPTANIDMGSYLRPRFGIYAVSARVVASGQVLHGAANLGVRPSFDPPREVLEPHFFDFSGDLYGQDLDIAFRHFLRPEAKFASLEALKAQMEADCEEARALLSGSHGLAAWPQQSGRVRLVGAFHSQARLRQKRETLRASASPRANKIAQSPRPR